MSKRYLYWIYDDTCFDMFRHGYIGVTKRPIRRQQEHNQRGRVPSNSHLRILLIGTEELCNAGTYKRWHGDNCKIITGRTRPNYNSKEYKATRAVAK